MVNSIMVIKRREAWKFVDPNNLSTEEGKDMERKQTSTGTWLTNLSTEEATTKKRDYITIIERDYRPMSRFDVWNSAEGIAPKENGGCGRKKILVSLVLIFVFPVQSEILNFQKFLKTSKLLIIGLHSLLKINYFGYNFGPKKILDSPGAKRP